MWSQFTNVTDRRTTCDGNTALCTKVHRAVKTNNWFRSTATDVEIVSASVFARVNSSSLPWLQRIKQWKLPSPTCPAVATVAKQYRVTRLSELTASSGILYTFPVWKNMTWFSGVVVNGLALGSRNPCHPTVLLGSNLGQVVYSHCLPSLFSWNWSTNKKGVFGLDCFNGLIKLD